MTTAIQKYDFHGDQLDNAHVREELQFMLRRPVSDEAREKIRTLTLSFLDDIKAPSGPQAAPTDPAGSSVYFILSESTGLIKIGFSKSPLARLRLFQAGSGDRITLLASEPGAGLREGVLHRRFKKSRAHGEWFRPSKDLIAYISTLEACP